MIVYHDSKRNFVRDVRRSVIADKILSEVRKRGLAAGADREFASWQNSMQFMRNIVDDSDIDDEVDIAIEYNIPLTSKRVDFIIAGADGDNHDNIVIVELKQWQQAEKVDDEMHYSVRTFVAQDKRIVCHPSYQAYSYSRFIYNYSQTVTDLDIDLVPCAYLHNLDPDCKPVLMDPIYRQWYTEAPLFVRNEVDEFSDFVKKYVRKRSSRGDLLYDIDYGRLRPTKALQDSLASMVKGNKEFMLLDEQVVIFDMCLKTMSKCLQDRHKRTIVIQGGPGTGKSVLAVNLLMEYISQGLNASYVTKNSAPRQAFLNLLTHSDARRAVDIKQLFRSPFGLSSVEANTYDCLIIDEAHRLVTQMYGDWKGQNQVKECIEASLLSIFMLDEDQSITTSDIGSVAEVSKWCAALGSRLIKDEMPMLVSQFRCNGSDAYIQFINNLLQVHEEAAMVDLAELNYDFRVYDDPCLMRDDLRRLNEVNNKSRMVAGYCYDWNVKNHRDEYDIFLDNGFKARWNLPGDNIWAVNPSSFEEVGCIHTAQGLEFDYVGVIIGKDLRFDPSTGRVVTDQGAISRDDRSSGIRTLRDPARARQLILNTYKTLLTRGQKGCFVYCEDPALRSHFKSCLPIRETTSTHQ